MQQADAFSTYLSARFAASEHDMPQAARYYGAEPDERSGQSVAAGAGLLLCHHLGRFRRRRQICPGQVVATTPDDRAARLALAVVAFKHKDYADARKQSVAVGQGAVHVLTLSLFDAWAAAAPATTRPVRKPT